MLEDRLPKRAGNRNHQRDNDERQHPHKGQHGAHDLTLAQAAEEESHADKAGTAEQESEIKTEQGSVVELFAGFRTQSDQVDGPDSPENHEENDPGGELAQDHRSFLD